MTAAFAIAFAAALVLALFDWRRGLLACLAVGFLQDTVRKLLPGQPVQLVVAVAAAFSMCVVGVYFKGEGLRLARLLAWFPRLRPPVVAFAAIVLLQCLHTLLRTGNGILAGIGLLAYFSPPLALLLGERYCNRFSDLRRWLFAYLSGAVIVGLTVLIQFSGVEMRVFSSIGLEFVYGGPTGVVKMMSGLMRSSEIAAWHLAAGACMLVAVAAAARSPRTRWLALAGFFGLLLAVALTGRRKMLAEVVLFLVLYGFLVGQYRRGGSRIAQTIMGLLFVGVLVGQLFATSGQVSELAPYLGRGATILADSTERLYAMTISQFRWVILENGFLGSGAGTGAQGSQYFGGGVQLVGGSAEGGLGKVLAELGVPGALALLWLAVAVGRVILRIARYARQTPPSHALLLYGLVAFLPANGVVFLTAHQVYGDPFVLIVLGLMTGAILAYPRMWMAESAEGTEIRSARPGRAGTRRAA